MHNKFKEAIFNFIKAIEEFNKKEIEFKKYRIHEKYHGEDSNKKNILLEELSKVRKNQIDAKIGLEDIIYSLFSSVIKEKFSVYFSGLPEYKINYEKIDIIEKFQNQYLLLKSLLKERDEQIKKCEEVELKLVENESYRDEFNLENIKKYAILGKIKDTQKKLFNLFSAVGGIFYTSTGVYINASPSNYDPNDWS